LWLFLFAVSLSVSAETDIYTELIIQSAEEGHAPAQYGLAMKYDQGDGVAQNYEAAAKWYRRASHQGHTDATFELGMYYLMGRGVLESASLGGLLIEKAAAEGHLKAQLLTGLGYGIAEKYKEAFKWMSKAAERGDPAAQERLGRMYALGNGVVKDYVQAYKWYNLAAAGGNEEAAKVRDLTLAELMTPQQIAQAQRLSRTWVAQVQKDAGSHPRGTGSGFYISEVGGVVTNYHVIGGCSKVTVNGASAKIQFSDKANDLALLLGPPSTNVAPLANEKLRLGETVIAIGYPLAGLLGTRRQATSGDISALTGPGDDSRFLQISAPVNPGSSGGPLLDTRGRVVGIVSSKLNVIEIARTTGSLPENVNFAIKATVLRAFLDSNDVDYEVKKEGRRKAIVDLVEEAKGYTVLISCYK